MAFIDAKRKALVWLGRYRGLYRGDVCHYFGGQTGMTTPDIAGLCERLRIDIAWADKKPEARTFVTAYVSDLREAADTLERQAAEIERLREALQEFSSEYDGFLDGDGHPCPTLARARAALTGEDT
jgi:hypothetical protein